MNTRYLTKRSFHTSTTLLIRGWQRKQFTEEMNRNVGKEVVERRKDRDRMEFDKIPFEEKEEIEINESLVNHEYIPSLDASKLEQFSENFDDTHSSRLRVSDKINTKSALNRTDTVDTEARGADFTVAEPKSSDVKAASGDLREESPVDASSVPVDESSVPFNIVGDLDSLFAELPQPSEEVVQEQTDVVESVSDADYMVYQTPWQGERYMVPEEPLSRWHLGTPIPLDHIVHFLRDLKCFDNEIIEVQPGSAVQQVIVTSVHNNRHLKDAARTFYRMCKDDYSMDMGVNEKSNAGFSWVVYDLSHSYIHFFLPSERDRINIDSFYLGQDVQLNEYSEESYTADLLEGLFPDEDFSKLGKPFELVHDQKERGRK